MESSVAHLNFTVASIMAREQKKAPTMWWRRVEEPGRREDDSEHVLKQQHTSEGQATVSAYSIGDPSSK